MTEYSIGEHRFRFAAWTASRAAGRGIKDWSTSTVQKVLEQTEGLHEIAYDLKKLPEPKEFDDRHENWCKGIVSKLEEKGIKVSFGRAAKIVNIFLKTLTLGCDPHGELSAKIAAVHPPIDRVLLSALVKNNADERKHWETSDGKLRRWTSLGFDEYSVIVEGVRKVTKLDDGLWTIERHWKPHD